MNDVRGTGQDDPPMIGCSDAESRVGWRALHEQQVPNIIMSTERGKDVFLITLG
jgi:hypothetical protein